MVIVNFSLTIKNELNRQKKSVSWFAGKLGLSVPYVYKLLDQRADKRWNEDSINKACKILGIKINFQSERG